MRTMPRSRCWCTLPARSFAVPLRVQSAQPSPEAEALAVAMESQGLLMDRRNSGAALHPSRSSVHFWPGSRSQRHPERLAILSLSPRASLPSTIDFRNARHMTVHHARGWSRRQSGRRLDAALAAVGGGHRAMMVADGRTTDGGKLGSTVGRIDGGCRSALERSIGWIGDTQPTNRRAA
ncbi:hypothetical protein DFJ74DRAFT_687813 [Hyaloraphidium curvatum]|nr:hypothetical protein DFJ74DRAFT_687813 [Hyaloraphidium curvatum]